jgi:Asp-tRNA(Asn)/Glu-tRNA(Gln) amidotransferase A subunit family amidase
MTAMLSVVDIARRIDAGELTPAEALRLGEAALHEREAEIGAFVHRASAADLDAAAARKGPLAGIAAGIKDIIDTADLPTEMGSPLYAGWRPKADAALVVALKGAGAAIAGKTATTPFAYLDPAVTRNPHNLGHTPGGSSSGSAASVAAGMVPLAIGTQTGGSVIRPASFCGVTGVKPSYRLIPTVGIKCYSWGLDTAGLFTATVEDAAYALAALTGRPNLRVDGRVPATPRVGVFRQAFAGEPEPASEAALSRAIRAAERGGAQVRSMPELAEFANAFKAHLVLQEYEALRALAWEWTMHRDALPPKLAAAMQGAETISAEAYDEARRVTQRARRACRDLFADVDVILTFAAPGEAPKGLGSTGDARYNRLWTLMGVPAVTLPFGRGPEGLPVGVQILAPFGRDATAFEAALFFQKLSVNEY